MLTLNREQATVFAQVLLKELLEEGVDLSTFVVDHICYETGTVEEYSQIKRNLINKIIPGLEGVLLTEAEVSGRPIATFIFDSPLRVDRFQIEALEVPSPKAGKAVKTGWDHVEIVIQESFEAFKNKYPHLRYQKKYVTKALNDELVIGLYSGRVKFHHLPLSTIIALENP